MAAASSAAAPPADVLPQRRRKQPHGTSIATACMHLRACSSLSRQRESSTSSATHPPTLSATMATAYGVLKRVEPSASVAPSEVRYFGSQERRRYAPQLFAKCAAHTARKAGCARKEGRAQRGAEALQRGLPDPSTAEMRPSSSPAAPFPAEAPGEEAGARAAKTRHQTKPSHPQSRKMEGHHHSASGEQERAQMVPTNWPLKMKERARARPCGGTHAARSALQHGIWTPSARPTTTRAARAASMDWRAAHGVRTVAADQTTVPISSTRLAPKRAAARPAGICVRTYPQKNDASSVPVLASPQPSSRLIAMTATERFVLSA
mmetsp:Transcript_11651/g.33682  ORF Transcript_11651/g.33682 Transcript_11651/m.33682 type:complete len:321 (+) Transcript_11651:455-1417(+)